MTEPISIFDLRRKTKQVLLNGGDEALMVLGLTARQICDHLERFPALGIIAVGGAMDIKAALLAVPGAAAAWIASALGHHNDADAEKAATDNLTIEDTAYLLESSLPLTFSRGFGPFVDRLAALAPFLSVGNGKAPATASPLPSQPSEPPIPTSVSAEPGTTLQGSSQP